MRRGEAVNLLLSLEEKTILFLLLIKSSFHFCCVLFPLCVLSFLFLIQLFSLSTHSGVITRSELLLSSVTIGTQSDMHIHTHK